MGISCLLDLTVTLHRRKIYHWCFKKTSKDQSIRKLMAFKIYIIGIHQCETVAYWVDKNLHLINFELSFLLRRSNWLKDDKHKRTTPKIAWVERH